MRCATSSIRGSGAEPEHGAQDMTSDTMPALDDGAAAATEAPTGDIALDVKDLQTWFYTRQGIVKAVDGVSFNLRKGETLGIVGESGCGKSITALSVMRLVPDPPGRIIGGRVTLDGRRSAGPRRGRNAPGARQRHLHDLPGADDLAQPGADHWLPDRRGADPAPGHEPDRGAVAGGGDARHDAHSRAGAAGEGVSAPAFRRHAPAGDDRDGARPATRRC